MATWLGEIKCPKCNHWQIPMKYCPKCGHKWQFIDYGALQQAVELAEGVSFVPAPGWVTIET